MPAQAQTEELALGTELRPHHPSRPMLLKVRSTGLRKARSASQVSVISVFDGLARPLFDGWIGVDRFPDTTERAAVLAAVKDAARR